MHETTDRHAAARQKEQTPEPRKLSRFFHSISHKLKARDSDQFVKNLGFDLDFVEIVTHPPADLTSEGALCMQRLERVKKVFVVSRDETKNASSVVNLEVTIAARKDVPVQGIFHAGTTAKTYILPRPFDEYRKLRKLIQFLVSCKPGTEHAREHEHSCGRSGDAESADKKCPAAQSCQFCTGLEKYAGRCWEVPPLMGNGFLPRFRKLVLTNSLAAFVHAARSQFDADIRSSEIESNVVSAVARDSVNASGSDIASTCITASSTDNALRSVADSDIVAASVATATAGVPMTATAGEIDGHQLQPLELPPSPAGLTPFCPAQAKLAVLLHDFLQLQQHL